MDPTHSVPSSDRHKVGAVLVVGGGVSGIQAALDTADSGFKVYLVDRGPSIGGRMSQLDKTFPTNDCSMCILSPKFIECATNPNISVITDTEVDGIEGDAGNFEVFLSRKPRYVDPAKCTGCGTCSEYCPVSVPDPYNEGLSTLKSIHLPFAQAVPAVSVIDPAHCLFLLRKECRICAPACRNQAIDFHQHEETLKIEVGSVILAPGYEPFQPEQQSQYGYGRFQNIVTSLEFERLLSASGPNRGALRRPSDGKPPKKIAWIQCVGSRDATAGHTYCSAVCCMYAMKQVILSKENLPDLDAVILHNDIRAYGKGFERYYERARKTPGVRFIWSKTSVLTETPGTGDVVLRYRVNGTGVQDEAFDLVVLSVGMSPPDGNRALAKRLSVATNGHGFCETRGFFPLETSRPGIFACGTFRGPMDIPDSVTMASGAASLASEFLSDRRGTQITEISYSPERDIAGEPPRIGVFVCDCGTNIVKGVDVAGVVEYAKGLEGVVHVEEDTFACSIDAITRMAGTIREKRLNRVVVAACTPRTHEPVFQGVLKKAGLNPHLFEMTNIREHCSWVHMGDRQTATRKAEDLVRMAVFKSRLLSPLGRLSYAAAKAALVIGGGISGMVSALALARQGVHVHLVEKDEELGGMGRRIRFTIEGGDVGAYVRGLIREVYADLGIQVYTEAELVDLSGYVGNFSSRIRTGNGRLIKTISHGVTIVATGAEEFRPHTFLYGEDPRVSTLLELEDAMDAHPEAFRECSALVMILCVGSRDPERPYCSRVCCAQAVKDALKLKTIHPEMEITVLYRDMRTYGFREDYYQEAADRGVVFIRYDADDKPDVRMVEAGGRSVLRVTVTEPVLGQRLMIDADRVALAAATIPPAGNRTLSQLLKVPLTEDGFFMEAHMKLRPVDFATDGIFMAGLAHGPKFMDESIAQARAAVSRAMTILSRSEIMAGGTICVVNDQRCAGCGVCQEICPFHAIEVMPETQRAVVHEALCKGCGLCVSSCRSGALDIKGFSEEQTLCLIEAATG
ncbi:MAG: FAD-dependent oxidoreductase [Deltaproteobacteria bacterium]|nr:FAD-dependent oxidoreductase [Deltaproteobacteria bacterium]